jgi:hypothetical protein
LINWGVAKLVKAPDFDSGMRRFESFLPSPIRKLLNKPPSVRRGSAAFLFSLQRYFQHGL